MKGNSTFHNSSATKPAETSIEGVYNRMKLSSFAKVKKAEELTKAPANSVKHDGIRCKVVLTGDETHNDSRRQKDGSQSYSTLGGTV